MGQRQNQTRRWVETPLRIASQLLRWRMSQLPPAAMEDDGAAAVEDVAGVAMEDGWRAGVLAANGAAMTARPPGHVGAVGHNVVERINV